MSRMWSMFPSLKSKSYLRHILLSITAIMFLIVTGSSFLFYYQSEQTVLRSQHDANKKVLYYLNYNLSYANEIIKNLAISVYFDKDTITAMKSKELQPVELSPILNKWDTVVGSTTSLQSILVYNAYTDRFYSSGSNVNLNSPDHPLTSKVRDYLQKSEHVQKMQLIPLKDENSDVIDHFLFFMYDSIGDFNRKESVFLFEVRTDWLRDILNVLNEIDGLHGGSVFLTGQNEGAFNLHSKKISDSIPDLNGLIAKEKNAQSGYVVYGKGSQKIIVTYMKGINDWYIVTVQPFSQVVHALASLRRNLLILTFASALLSIVAAWLISRKLYQPVARLVNQVKRFPGQTSEFIEFTDEFSYVSKLYGQAVEQWHAVKSEQESTEPILKTYRLRRWIADSESMPQAEFDRMATQFGLKLEQDADIVLAVLKVDDFEVFREKKTSADKKLLQFAVCNITSELLAREFNHEIVSMGDDHFVVLMTADGEATPLFGRLEMAFREIQRVILTYYKLSLTAAFSKPFKNWSDVSQMYADALLNSSYRIVFGKNAIITPSKTNERANRAVSDFSLSTETQRKIEESLKMRDQAQLEQQLDQIFADLTDYDYDQILLGVTYIIVMIGRTLHEINANRLSSVRFDLGGLLKQISSKDTLTEQLVLIKSFVNSTYQEKNPPEETKNRFLVDTIKEIIRERYSDMNLNVQAIASMLKMSSDYIGKIFKIYESITISDYTNEVRLEKALELLWSTDESAIVISEKVGYGSESYFHRQFKKKYGVTPKEYRIKKYLKGVDN